MYIVYIQEKGAKKKTLQQDLLFKMFPSQPKKTKSLITLLVFRLIVGTLEESVPQEPTDSEIREYFISNLPSVCPNLRSCSKGSETVTHGNAAGDCCHCICEDYCFSFHNCCPDKKFNRTASLNTIQKSQIKCFSNRPYGNTDVVKIPIVEPYAMVAKCPREYDDGNLKRKCENASESSLEESLPVVSKSGELPFRNQFCALCNGEPQWTTWQVQYRMTYDSFEEIASAGSLSHVDVFEMKMSGDNRFRDLTIVFIAPEDRPPRAFSCYELRHSECKEGSPTKVMVYDALLEGACKAYDLPYGNRYKNPYCGVCNDFSPSDCMLKNQWVSFSRIVFLISYNSKNDVRPLCSKVQAQFDCQKNFIYDIYQDRCRRIYCPLLQIETPDGNCATLFSQMKYGSVLFLLKFTSLNNTDAIDTSDVKLKVAQSYIDQLQRDIHPLPLTVVILAQMSNETNTSTTDHENVYFIILMGTFAGFVSVQYDPLTYLYNHLTTAEKFTFSINSEKYVFSIEFANRCRVESGQIIDLKDNKTLTTIISQHNSKTGVVLRKQLFCRQIRLQAMEVNDLPGRKIQIIETQEYLYENEFHKIGPNDKGNYEYVICLDDYIPSTDCVNEAPKLFYPFLLYYVLLIGLVEKCF